MIRSLLIRQSFLVADAALIVLALATGVLCVVKFLEAPVMPPPPPAPMADGGNEKPLVHQPGERPAYESILTARLFGDAGAYDPGASPVEAPPPPPEGEVEGISELNLRVLGTTATQTLASAIIEDGSQPGSARSFYIGDTVMEKVTLAEVFPRYIIIINDTKGEKKRERVGMDDEKESTAAVATPAPAPNGNTDRMTLNRQELMTDLMTSYQDLVTKVKPELYRDASGKVVGITANNIGQIPIAKKLGLSDGDVLQTVNNEPIDSEAKVMEMITKYQNANAFRIGIMRNGKPKVVTYRLE